MKKVKVEIKINWKKIMAVFFCTILLSGIALYVNGVKKVKAATVGQQLSAPESGWTRYDNLDSRISYKGSWTSWPNASCYDGALLVSTVKNDTISFRFYGTMLRIMAYMDTTYANDSDVNISIDGIVSTYTEYKSAPSPQQLVFQKTDLSENVHTITITVGSKVSLDAIDIDSAGYLINPSTVISNGLSLDKTSLNMNIGDTNTLTAKVTPSNATNQAVAWTSSDPSIATIDNNGKITALKVGAVTITATTKDGTNLSAQCAINVGQAVTGITLDKTSLDMNVNDTDTLTAKVTPLNATNQTVAWTSSDPSIATIDNNGKITALKVGAVTITATTKDGTNLSAQCAINVNEPNAGNGLLTVTMTNGQQKTYDLKMSQINDFITWFNNRESGSGGFTYSFDKAPTSAAYSKRTEYLIYDKISNYDVDQYNSN